MAVALLLGGGCGEQADRDAVFELDHEAPHVSRPSAAGARCTPGEHELRITPGRRALLRVTQPGPSRRRALLVALHGAGSGGAPGGLWAFRGAWDVPGLVIVAPAAMGTTWTLERTDIEFVARALQLALARCPVDSRRVAIGGFSAGAGLALWLGLTNGDVFRAVIALSGGSSLPGERKGRPAIFIAHGTADQIIPIAYGGERSAAQLRSEGYNVTYRRFRGGHRVVPSIARASVVKTLFG